MYISNPQNLQNLCTLKKLTIQCKIVHLKHFGNENFHSMVYMLQTDLDTS